MDEKDRLLLTHLQSGLPLTPRPFATWAAKLGTDSADLLVRIQRLKKEGTLGGVKAVLDARIFHYQSAWVALRFGTEDLASRTEVLWQHPGVTYGCEREHEFNVWLFISAPENHDLELHVRCLAKISGAEKVLFLPVRRVYKGTDLLSSLGPETFSEMDERFEKRQPGHGAELTTEDIDMIRRLQEPFPLTDEPYQKIAADLGITEFQAIEQMKSLVAKKCLKRIGSFLKPVGRIGQEHQAPAEAVLKDWPSVKVPGAGNLVVWQIPEEKLERSGPEIAAFREVIYADRRPAYPEFPYSLYTTIRAETPEALELITRRMQDRIGKWPHRVMVTTRELKKTGMKYFPKELDAWWQQNRHINETAFN